MALDVGSTKTCALIGELDEDGGAKFVAMGAAESKGWRKGLIVNLDLAVSSIRRARRRSRKRRRRARGIGASIGVAGSHVRGVNSRGGITLGARPRDINATTCAAPWMPRATSRFPEDREVLHVLPQEFSARRA